MRMAASWFGSSRPTGYKDAARRFAPDGGLPSGGRQKTARRGAAPKARLSGRTQRVPAGVRLKGAPHHSAPRAPTVRALDPAPVLRSGHGAIGLRNWREETEMTGLTALKAPYKQLPRDPLSWVLPNMVLSTKLAFWAGMESGMLSGWERKWPGGRRQGAMTGPQRGNAQRLGSLLHAVAVPG